ncbi:hypothetical protein [Alicyclobacillus mali (ex Roth et al. 2021)]|nr:hypothetical protein [Alicyclobacillus mali (ex Roth et al. 2021)]
MRRRHGLAYAAASLAVLTFLGVSGDTVLAATNSTTSPTSTSSHRPFPRS